MEQTPHPRPGPGRHRDPAEPDPATEPEPATEPPTAPPQPAAHPEPTARPDPQPRPRRTRRWVLAGSLAVLAGGGAGVGAAFLRHRSPARPPEPLPVLVAAAAAERALLADLVATTGGTAEVRVLLEQAQADHRAHLNALEGLLGAYRRPAATASSGPAGTARTKAQLQAAETAAARSAARRAEQLTGRAAALLASIAACEATHAEVLG